MFLVLSILFFLLGTIIGSFLNVVIYRYNTGKSINGRSACMSCGSKLRPTDLIPLFSWLLLKGRCRNCQSKISAQYPLVEFTTGSVFFLIFSLFYDYLIAGQIHVFFTNVIFWLIVFSIFIIIFVYDLWHKIIPDGLVFTLIFLGALYQLLSFYGYFGIQAIQDHIFDFLAGFILFVPFYLLWVFSRGRWIGFGDAKLAVAIGFLLGLVSGASAIILAFWIGAVFSIIYLLILRLSRTNNSITIKSEIPFAPFMILGFLVEFVFHLDVLGLSLFF